MAEKKSSLFTWAEDHVLTTEIIIIAASIAVLPINPAISFGLQVGNLVGLAKGVSTFYPDKHAPEPGEAARQGVTWGVLAAIVTPALMYLAS